PMVLGGTLLEVAAPVAAGVVLYRQRDWFGVSVSLCWLGIVCFGVATYAGDAVARALPLVSPFGAEGATHDWANILGHFGALRHTATVAAAWEWGGRFFMTLGIVSGARILVIMRHETRAAGAVHGFHPS
ncbi:MAG TPA: hypothetical protein VK966_02360, partial [Longimicrobiales bacterium]|nr:hypothetical protein [Longimicrobiales bacterium]